MSERPGAEQAAAEEVQAFWERARSHADLNAAPGYFGPSTLESVTPPSYSLGATPDECDQAIAALLDGSGTTLETPTADLPEDRSEWPDEGMLGIVLDGAGHPRLLVATTRVDVLGDRVVEHLEVVFSV